VAVKTSRGETAIGVSAQDVEILVGDDLEFLTEPSLVTIHAGQSATGLSVTVKRDTEALVDSMAPNIIAAAGRLIDPDDIVISEVALPPGTRLKITVDNTTAGALTFSHKLTVDEIPEELLAEAGF